MKFVPIGEICTFKYGSSLRADRRNSGNVPVFGPNGQVGWHDEAYTNGETIIIGRKGSIGEVHFSGVPCYPIDTTYYVDKTKRPCNLKWLYYMLKAADLSRLDKSAAVPGLNREDAYNEFIPQLDMTEQKRIVALLEEADHARRTRRFTQVTTERILQEVCMEMFGDPITIPMGWDLKPLQRLCAKIVDCLHSTPEFANEQTPYGCIRSSDIQDGYLDWSSTKYLTESEYKRWIQREEPRWGDVFYCREGARLGNAARIITYHKVALGQRMMLFRPNLEVTTPEYVWAYLESTSVKNLVWDLVGGSASPHVNIKDLRMLSVPVPPLHKQQEYACLVQEQDRARTMQFESTRQTEHLFQTLLYRAFRRSCENVEKFVCVECLGDDYAIRDFVLENAVSKECSYCRTQSSQPVAVEFPEVAEFIEQGLRSEYTLAADELGWASEMGGWIGDHFDSSEMIEDCGLLLYNYALQEDIIAWLGDQTWCKRDAYADRYSDVHYWDGRRSQSRSSIGLGTSFSGQGTLLHPTNTFSLRTCSTNLLQ
jgi:type I restriction enzyme S subunit